MLRWMMMLALSVTCLTAHAQLSRDEGQIRSSLYSFSALADQGAFEYLGRLLAPQVNVDYTSLFEGETEVLEREELMRRWAGFLPGFDVTFHQLNNIQVAILGTRATATADVTASHWLDEGFWAVTGSYEFTLSSVQGQWLITGMKLIVTEEAGSRDMLSQAPEAAVQNLQLRNAAKLTYQ